MPLTPRFKERLAAVLGEPLECLECERPIEPECPSIISCFKCFQQRLLVRPGYEPARSLAGERRDE